MRRKRIVILAVSCVVLAAIATVFWILYSHFVSYSYKEYPHTENAPTLGPTFRDCLIAYYEADGDKLMSMLSTEDRDWNKTCYEEARALKYDEKKKEYDKQIEEIDSRLSTMKRGSPEWWATAEELELVRDLVDEVGWAHESASPAEFFQKRLSLRKAANDMMQDLHYIYRILSGIKVTGENISGDEGVLTYALHDGKTYEVHFKRENGKWKMCGLRHMGVFECQLSRDIEPKEETTPAP